MGRTWALPPSTVLSPAAIRAGLRHPSLLPGLGDRAWPHRTFPGVGAQVRFGTFLFYFHIYKLKQPFSEREGRGCLEEKLGSWALHRVGHLGLFNWETVPYLKGPHDQMASGGRGLLLGAWEMRYLRLPLSRVLLLVNLVIQLRVWDDRIIRKGSVQWLALC